MIFRWTIKSLLAEPAGFIASASAVAAAYLLVMSFGAIWSGEAEQLLAYPRNSGADVWVMQRGVSNMHMATSLIGEWKEEAVASVEGVADVTPILYLPAILHAGGRDWITFVVGINRDARRGGPWAMARGNTRPNPGEVVLPKMMAVLSDVGLGSDVQIADKMLSISGLTDETFSMGNPVAFVHMDDLADILSTSDYFSYLLVQAEPGVDRDALAIRIREEVENVNALSQEIFLQNDYHMAMQMGLELVELMTVICALLALLLIAFTLYTRTLRSRREMAIAKALGFSSRHLYVSVALQALIVSSSGFVISYISVHMVMALASAIAPQITMHLTGRTLLSVGVIGLIVAALAMIVPARQVARIEPHSAFQS